MITYISCTTFVLEALGDVPGFEDSFIDTAMGSVSFFQSCYYAFMLMSTVGFGDFSPQTVRHIPRPFPLPAKAPAL